MSFAAEGYYPVEIPDRAPVLIVDEAERAPIRPVLFAGPILFSGISYVAGGIPILTDMSFLMLANLCAIFLIRELAQFPKRQGIGGLLIYGGVLIWFCHDYFFNWFEKNFNDGATLITPGVVAKAAFYHMVFIDLMIMFYKIPFIRWVEKVVTIVPEPSTPQFYLLVLVLMMCVGFLPFYIFVNEPFYVAIWKTFILDGGDVKWSVGRSIVGKAANLNYEWGGYVVQILQVGTVGGIFGAAYAILIARSWIGKTYGWLCWYYWVAYSFPGLRRGDMAFIFVPVVGLLFYKYQVLAVDFMRKAGWKAYTLGGVVGVALYVIVQYQGSTRDNVSLDVVSARGDTMFSEGIRAWAFYGEDASQPYFYDKFPGASAILPVPVTLFWFVIDPIPRALWNNKPIDEFDSVYNDMMTGEHLGATGTTVSSGAVGAWYFRYGPCGVIEGAIIYGWLIGLAERSLRRANGRPMGVLFSLCFATFMFRCYRDLWFHSLYPIMIGGGVLFVFVKLFASGATEAENQQIAAASA